jgi:CRP-like cAMP-binding protein
MSEDIGPAAEARRLLQETKLFASLSENVRLRLASFAQEKFVVPGELLMREGDAGEEFFLIASGSVHVIGRAFDGTNLVMARLTRGQVFGEQALLQGGSRIRNASVRAAERCRVFVFPREALTEVQEVDETLRVKLSAIGDRQAAERRELLREKVLQDIGLGANYQIKRFDKDQIIFHEGDPAGDVYLILDGTARVTRGDGDATVLAELLPGQFFGELAILNHAPRAATVRATSTLETAALDGTWFRSAVAAQPGLQSIMASLQAMYLLPARGLITLQGGTLEIIVKREPRGLLSPWLFDSLEKNSALRVSPPRGAYYLDSNNTVDVVFFAGGIGITPALAMARTYAASPRDWHLHIDHSVSFEEQAICDHELRLFAAGSAGTTFNLRLTRPDGRLSASSLAPLIKAHPQGRFYLCGSPGYVESVQALLTQAGVAEHQIQAELFTPIG